MRRTQRERAGAKQGSIAWWVGLTGSYRMNRASSEWRVASREPLHRCHPEPRRRRRIPFRLARLSQVAGDPSPSARLGMTRNLLATRYSLLAPGLSFPSMRRLLALLLFAPAIALAQ